MKPAPADSPCLGCGLCCDGTLFNRANLEADEMAQAKALDLPLLKHKGIDHFAHPCAMFRNGGCAIYDTRFEVCRAFRCALLRRVQDAETSVEEARQVIAEARRLQHDAAELVPEAAIRATRIDARARLSEQMTAADGEARKTIAARLLKVVALEAYLDRWFYVPKKRDGKKDGAA